MNRDGPGKVLITGAGGFIGSHLVHDQLARGRAVVAVDLDLSRLEASKPAGPLTRVQLDIRALDELRPLLEGVDTVFHLAAAHLDVLKDEDYFFDVNVHATVELVRAAAAAAVGCFVHCSTVGVYGPLQSLPADEDTPPAPDIPYERSKLAGEEAVRKAAAECKLPAVIIRPAWVYGPNCPRTLKLLRTVARKRFFFVGDGAALRHPIYISDMLAAFELAATQPLPGCETIIVAGPDTVSVQRLVEEIIRELGMTYKPARVPTWVMEPACVVVEKLAAVAKKEPPFSRRSLKFFTDSSAFTTSKAERLLGFKPLVETRMGLRHTIEYYRQQGSASPF